MNDDQTSSTQQVIETSEAVLENHLRLKPPPNYVARCLVKSQLPEDLDAWFKTVDMIGATNIAQFADILNLHEPTISELNYLIFKDEIERLDKTIAVLRSLCEVPSNFVSASQQAQGVECLSYLLTERSLGWLQSAAGGIALNPNNPDLLKALDLAEQAVQLSLQFGNYFLASRAAYNIGRIHAIAGLSPEIAATLTQSPADDWFSKQADEFMNAPIKRELAMTPLLASLNYLAKSVSEDGLERDEYGWNVRRVEALHRLVEIAATGSATLELVPALIEYLKVPWLSLKTARRVLEKRPSGADMIAVVEVVPAVVFNFGAIAQSLDPQTAVFNYTILDDIVNLTLIQGAKVTAKAFNPNRIGGFYERFFRPTSAQFGGITDDRNQPRLSWQMSSDTVHMTPLAGDKWNIATKQDDVFLDSNSGWKRSLHDVLIAPFEAQLSQTGVNHLVLMADLALMLVPFQLLENSAGVPVHQRYRISYCPSYALLVDALSRQKDLCRPDSVLIVPHPTLTFAPWEQAMIASLFPPENVRVLQGPTANKEAVVSAVRDVDVVHFATHGSFDSENPARSGVKLPSDEWLTLDEMRQLELKDGALVFLSACETARLNLAGRSTPLGIVPSLFEAGATTVIATFWPVNDLSTALVAKRFYENWLVRNLSKLDSLSEAAQWIQTVSGDEVADVVKRSQQPQSTDVPPDARSMESILTGLKKLFGQSAKKIPYPYTTDYYWGPFALYGAWQ